MIDFEIGKWYKWDPSPTAWIPSGWALRCVNIDSNNVYYDKVINLSKGEESIVKSKNLNAHKYHKNSDNWFGEIDEKELLKYLPKDYISLINYKEHNQNDTINLIKLLKEFV